MGHTSTKVNKEKITQAQKNNRRILGDYDVVDVGDGFIQGNRLGQEGR